MASFFRSALVRVSLRNGLIAGGIAVILLIAMYYLGQHPAMVSPYLDFRIFIFGIFCFFSLKEIRETHPDRILYFWQAMVGSYLLVIIATAIGSVGLYLFAKLEPSFVTSYIEGMTAYLKTFTPDVIKSIGKEVYDRNLKDLPSTNPATLMVTYFGQGIAIGFFVSIILSAILRKQPKTP